MVDSLRSYLIIVYFRGKYPMKRALRIDARLYIHSNKGRIYVWTVWDGRVRLVMRERYVRQDFRNGVVLMAFPIFCQDMKGGYYG